VTLKESFLKLFLFY